MILNQKWVRLEKVTGLDENGKLISRNSHSESMGLHLGTTENHNQEEQRKHSWEYSMEITTWY